MPKIKKSRPQAQSPTPVKSLKFIYKRHRVQVLLDKVLFVRFIRNLHGRFWGIASMLMMFAGFSVCFIIRPDLLHISTPFSEFGTDVRTAPYFAGAVFFTAYGLWRWRNYLHRTWRRARPVTGLITLTILGLYLVALMPVSWRPVPYYVHMFGVSLAGISMLITVILDGLLTKTRQTSRAPLVRLTRFASFALIVAGGLLTLGSAYPFEWFHVSLFGEIALLGGYFVWVVLKTYEGEGNRTVLSHILKKVILID